MAEKTDLIERYVTSIDWLRDLFSDMDKVGDLDPLLGIADWDDACCVEFGKKKLVASVDGPYCARIAFRSALIHASTDVVVKGGKPLFALDTLMGEREEVEEMAESLKRQALSLEIPILGGNTKFEDVEPQVTVTVIGELIVNEPIRDDGAKKGDLVCVLGEPIWGEEDDRIEKAKKLFSCWFEILKNGIKINAAKDVTKGGLVSVVYEMETKSKKKILLKEKIPFSLTRNLDNFILCVEKEEFEKIKKVCEKRKIKLEEIGEVE
ncbi:MAG: AIR synthase related protein [Candidatus Altiarchaeota archaeon]